LTPTIAKNRSENVEFGINNYNKTMSVATTPIIKKRIEFDLDKNVPIKSETPKIVRFEDDSHKSEHRMISAVSDPDIDERRREKYNY